MEFKGETGILFAAILIFSVFLGGIIFGIVTLSNYEKWKQQKDYSDCKKATNNNTEYCFNQVYDINVNQ